MATRIVTCGARAVSTAAAGVSTPTRWEATIGLEVHAQISSRSKLFSGAAADAELATPSNENVALFDVAHPGTLPRLNSRCVLAATRAALALGCTVQPTSAFDRKHYFYADLPAGYQITQLDSPVATGGRVHVDVPAPRGPRAPALAAPQSCFHSSLAPPARSSASDDGAYRVTVGIDRIQIEQDSAKSSHTWEAPGGNGVFMGQTLVDANRAGVGLLEIVTRPDMQSSREAGLFLRKLHALLRHIGVCEGAIEEGHLRCDVNVSLRPAVPQQSPGDACSTAGVVPDRPFGPRVEMKNVASIRAVERAIDAEIERQLSLLSVPPVSGSESSYGARVRPETRVFDAAAGTSTPLRSKGGAADYRFMPEPDVLPLWISLQYVEQVRASMPALPDAIAARLETVNGLSAQAAAVLVREAGAVEYFDAAVAFACAATPDGERDARAAMAGDDEGLGWGIAPEIAAKRVQMLQHSRAVHGWLTTELFGRLTDMPRLRIVAASSASLALHDSESSGSGSGVQPSRMPAGTIGSMSSTWATTATLTSDVGVFTPTPTIADCLLAPQRLGQLVAAVVSGAISGKVGKDVLTVMLTQAYTPGTSAAGVAEPMAIARSMGCLIDAALQPRPGASGGVSGVSGVSGVRGVRGAEDSALEGASCDGDADSAVRRLCEAALADPRNASTLTRFRSGYERAAGALVGAVVQASRGRVLPADVARVMGQLLGPCPPRAAQPQQPQQQRASATPGPDPRPLR